MNKSIFLAVGLFACVAHAAGPERIYRCGNEYTNTVPEGNPKGCKVVEGGNVSVVQAHRSPSANAGGANGQPLRVATAGQASQRVDALDQRSRDADARQILEAELKKAETRQQELAAEYNKGEPEKRGDEHRNHQKYLDRVAGLKASLARNESDIAGIRRELTRALSSSATTVSK